MNRRDFLGLVSSVIASVYAISKLPFASSTEEARKITAEQFLTKAFNKHMKGSGTRYPSIDMVASKDLFQSFAGSIQTIQRYTSLEPSAEYPGKRNLIFKSARLYNSDQPGWWVRIQDKTYYEWNI